MIPAPFQGAWRRTSIAIAGRPPAEPADVVWVQTARAFVDLHVRRSCSVRTAAFAGTTTWHEPHLHWSHELDLGRCDGVADIGSVSWRDGDLVERGALIADGLTIPYVEVWERLPHSDGARVSLRRDDGRALFVVAGSHAAIAVQDHPGGTYRSQYVSLRPNGWRAALDVHGPVPALDLLLALSLDLDDQGPSPQPVQDDQGHTWFVDDDEVSRQAGRARCDTFAPAPPQGDPHQ